MILLVDDDPIQLKLTQLHLTNAGYEVTIAMNGTAALAAARVAAPDLIVSDVVMRGFDGFALCRELRSEGHHIPTVLLSAQTDNHKRALARELGAYELVERTEDFGNELAAVRSCLEIDFAPARSVVSYEQQLTTTATELAAMVDHTRVTEERYHLLLDHASDAVSVLTTDGFVLEANKRWETLVGVPVSEMIGTHIRDYWHPMKTDESYLRLFADAVAKRQDINVVPLRHANGHAIHVEFSTQVVELDGREVVLAIGRDITDRVESARRAADAERELRSIVERIPDCVWRADAEGAIVFCTPNIEAITGFPPELMIGKKREAFWGQRIHPEDRAQVAAALAKAYSATEPTEIEYRFMHRNERCIWLRSRVWPRRDDNGVLVIEGLTTDITKHRQLEESLAHAQKMEAIGQLSGGVAHDFNNILAVILAHSSFLQDDLTPADLRRESVDAIMQAAERAAGLTRQLLAFSRRQVLELQPVDVNAVMGGLHKMLARLIGEDIALALEPAAQLGTVRADVGQLEQVLVNLVVNARDAMPCGGSLTVETANVELDQPISVSGATVPAGSYVALTVSDTGCGMDAATQQRVFEPFFTTKQAGKGTGLGLSTCYGIVSQLGGYIWCNSQPGRGTIFEVYLPRVDEVVKPAPPKRATRYCGTETVLVVEDDTRLRAVVHRILKSHGFRVIVAERPEHAVDLARDERIDLILSDVVMPEIAGPELAQRIREVAPASKLLLMSGYSDHPALASFADDMAFLPKPFTVESLIKKVRETLDGAS